MAGLFLRMEDERIPKENVFNEKFENARPVGKPRTRWEDVVRRDTSLGMRGWRKRAEDREKWRRLLREGSVQQGL
jgi:hypothetical protein